MILRIVILRILFHHYNSPYSILVCPHSLVLPGSGGIKGAVPPLRSQSFGPAQPDWLLALSSSSRLSARLYSVYLIVFVYLCWVNTEASSLDDCPSNLFIQVKVRSWAEPYIWWTCHFRTLPFQQVFEPYHLNEFSNSAIWTSFRTLSFEQAPIAVERFCRKSHRKDFFRAILNYQSNKGTLLVISSAYQSSRKVLQKKLSKGLFPGNPLLSE